MSSPERNPKRQRSRYSDSTEIPTTLHQACESGNLPYVKKLIDATNMNEKDENGKTPLHIVCIPGWIQLVTYLIGKNADVNATDARGQTPLHDAVSSGYKPVSLRALLNQGRANPNLQDSDDKTALLLAVARRMTILVKILLQGGVDPSICDTNRRNVLYDAVMSHHLDAIFLLQEHLLPNVFIQLATSFCNLGKTAVHVAAERGYAFLVKFFFESGISTQIPDSSGNTVLHEACRSGCYCCVEKIFEKTTDLLDYQNVKGDTALHISSSKGETVISRLLIEKNASVTVKNNAHETPLSCAIKNLHDKTCEIQKCPSPEDRAWQLQHDLMLAVYHGMVDVVSNLTQYLDVNSQDENGNTVLHSAARNGRDGMLQILLDQGACVHTRNRSGESVEDVAKAGSHGSVIYLLSVLEKCRCRRPECLDYRPTYQPSD